MVVSWASSSRSMRLVEPPWLGRGRKPSLLVRRGRGRRAALPQSERKKFKFVGEPSC